jgi:[histone H3]-lysine4 N-trimethyltransferase SETD1
MSRDPTAATLDFRTHTQSMVDGGRDAKDDRSLRRADSSVSARSRLPGVTSAGTGENNVTEDNSTTHSPNDHGLRSTDLLNRAGSDSSVPSSASSVFSTANNMSFTGHNPSLHALTPLTSTDSSPPGKLPSPRSAKPSHETMYATSNNAPSSAIAKTAADTITPVHTPPEARISIWPADGKLGQRLYYDPMMDDKLDSRAKRAPPPYKDIYDKVREGHTCFPEMGCPATLRLT